MDQALFLHLNQLPGRIPVLAGPAVTIATYGLGLYAAMLVFLWWRGAEQPEWRRHLLLLALLAALVALGVNAVLNVLLPRPRPYVVLPAHVLLASPPQDASFPSDHAAVAASIAFALLLGGEALWGGAALAGAGVVGTARVIVGVHYPSDILGAMLVGAACAVAVLRAHAPLRPVLTLTVRVARCLRLA